jgi:hypothetical protein
MADNMTKEDMSTCGPPTNSGASCLGRGIRNHVQCERKHKGLLENITYMGTINWEEVMQVNEAQLDAVAEQLDTTLTNSGVNLVGCATALAIQLAIVYEQLFGDVAAQAITHILGSDLADRLWSQADAMPMPNESAMN